MKKTLLWTLAAIAAMGITGCTGKSSPTLVTVNGENISNDDLGRYLAKKPTVRVNTASGVVEAQVAEPLDFQALQDMIGQKVVIQLAKDEGVSPTEKEVIDELEFRKRLNANYVTELTQNGITFKMIQENLNLELAREKLLTKGITVTMEEAKKYVKDNPAQFMEPAKADLLWVFVKAESKKPKVDDQIRSGQTFSAIAIELSDFPTAKEQGGRFPQQELQRMPQQLQEMVKKTEPGKTTDWLKLDDGWAKFYVQSKTPQRPVAMSDDRLELVRRSLARERGEKATDLPKRVLDKIRASNISVSDATLRDSWTKAFERLQKEAEQNASGANPTGGGTAGGAPSTTAGATGN